VAGRYQADIKLTKDDITVDAKSIMGVLMLAAECGSEVLITVEGSDEEEAMAAIAELLERESE
jgi:phosphocarrier protein